MKIGCLDPKLILNPDPREQDELWKSIARCCGWTRRKAIAEIPKNLSFGHHLKSGPEKLRLLERIRLAQERLCLVDPPVVAATSSWTAKAEATPWVTDLVSDDPQQPSSKPWNTSEAFWDLECENHRSCPWEDPEMQAELRVLLRKTRRIDVMDRYLIREPAVANLHRVLARIKESGCLDVPRLELVIHCSPEEKDGQALPMNDDSLSRRFRLLRTLPFRTKIMLWKKEGLHSRYLLADQGGLTLGESFTWPTSQPVHFTFMNAHQEIRRTFSPHSEHGRLHFLREYALG